MGIPLRPKVDVEGGRKKREAAANNRQKRKEAKREQKQARTAVKEAERRRVERELQQIRQEAADLVFSQADYYGAPGLGGHEGIQRYPHQNPKVDLGWFSKPKTVWYPITTSWGRWGWLVWTSRSGKIVFEEAEESIKAWREKEAKRDTRNKIKNTLQPQQKAQEAFVSHGYQALKTQIVNTSQGTRVVRVQLKKDGKYYVGTFFIEDPSQLTARQVNPNEFSKKDWWRNK